MSRRREIMRSKSPGYVYVPKRSARGRGAYLRKRVLPAPKTQTYAFWPDETKSDTSVNFRYTFIHRTGEQSRPISDILLQKVVRNESGDPTVLSRRLEHSCPRPACCPLPPWECGDYDWEE